MTSRWSKHVLDGKGYLSEVSETNGVPVRRTKVLFVGLLLSAAVATGCSGGSSGSTGSQTGVANGETLVNEKCARCHGLDRVQGARKSAADWEATVSRMQGNGLKITDAEKTAIVDYLAKTYAQ
jgi:mono/diheme cytochrome c family protein